METKLNLKNNLLSLVRFSSASALAVCSAIALFHPESASSQQAPSTDSKQGGLEQQNTINPIDSENPSSLRQNPATIRQDSLRNDSLTAPNSNTPGRGTYTGPRSGSPTDGISPSGTQGSMTPSMNPSMGVGGNADRGVGDSRLTSPNTGGSGSGPSTDTNNMRVNGTTNSTSGTQDSMSPSTGVSGSTDSGIGGSRLTSPNTGGSGSGPSTNTNMRVNGTTNSPTGGSVNSTTEMNGTTNNSGSSSNTSGAVQGLW